MTALVVRAGAEHLPLPDASVDLVCTSPPYFGLRSYQDDGKHYDGQVGSEATPAEFLDVLIRCTAEWMRVLKPSGSIWVNLGDKYSGAGRGNNKSAALNNTTEMMAARLADSNRRQHVGLDMAPAKSLMGLPWRYAIRCIDDLGLILRAEVVWSKPNGFPESVQDRVRRSHEQWFHMTKLPRYYSAVDEIREGYAPSSLVRYKRGGLAGSVGDAFHPSKANGQRMRLDGAEDQWRGNPLGKLPGSVWTIPTEPLSLPDVSPLDRRPLPDHFAAFPLEWPRRIVRGWSPAEVCTACGEGLRPTSTSTITADRGGRQFNPASGNIGVLGKEREYRITGYVCACPDTAAPTTPGVVVDPFGGTGTVALMAHALGRVGVSVDYSHDYSRVARYRTTDRGQLAKAMQVEKPEPVMSGQADLFGESA